MALFVFNFGISFPFSFYSALTGEALGLAGVVDETGADSFFFEEGREKQFARAIYGVFKVSENGDALLIGMADAKGRILANTGTN